MRRFMTPLCEAQQQEKRKAMIWTSQEWIDELHHIVESSPRMYWNNRHLGDPRNEQDLLVGWEEGYSPMETLICWREYSEPKRGYDEKVRRQLFHEDEE